MAAEDRQFVGDVVDDKFRNAYARDRDRVLYSSAFRRLSGVTQVVSSDETFLFHNRLTHSIKVAQIARRLAEKLLVDQNDEITAAGGLDPDAVEAAALAHDLGHPPFGHIAETVLQVSCGVPHEDYTEDPLVTINGFEGNAQSFRIVTRLALRSATQDGLDLTRRTLNGILKYPWLRAGENADNRKWGAYESEKADFEFARAEEPETAIGVQSLEAAIMDWADDITYGVHDLEDFFRAGLTPLAQFDQADHYERDRFLSRVGKALGERNQFSHDEAASSFNWLLEHFIGFSRPYDGTNEMRREIHIAASNLIKYFIENTRVQPDGRQLALSSPLWHRVNLLKQLTWHYVINSPDLASVQQGQKRIIRGLFVCLLDWSTNAKENDRLPTRLREILKATKGDSAAKHELDQLDPHGTEGRAVADYISSLTEAQALELYGRLHGTPGSSMLQGFVRA